MLETISSAVCSISPWPEYNDLIIFSSFMLGAFLFSWTVNFIAKKYIVEITQAALHRLNHKWAKVILEHKSLHRLSHVVLGIVIHAFAKMLQNYENAFIKNSGYAAEKIIFAYIGLAVCFTLFSLLRAISAINATRKFPIRTYIQVGTQVGQVMILVITLVIVVCNFLNIEPTAFLATIGAAAAIIVVIFKDSIVGFMSSIQLSLYDIIRIGDWIKVPNLGIDGNVVEVSLSTVKIRNFDKTIITVPSYSLLNGGVQNWRGMSESGGRRIKRTINVDIDSMKFCTKEELNNLRKVEFVKEFIDEKLKKYNEQSESVLNSNPITNLEIFRCYLREYLKNHEQIYNKPGFTNLVREMALGSDGSLPIEIYVFTGTEWLNYENVQADVIDHILCAAPIFGLKVFRRR